MSVVLAMMAKAPEADVIRAIKSAIHLVDSIVIVVEPGDPLMALGGPDFGATFNKPGKIIEAPWSDHATRRTTTYRHASDVAGPHGWVLMIDSRDVVAANSTAPWQYPISSVGGERVDAFEIPIDMRFPGGRWRWTRRGHVMRAQRDIHWAGPAGIHETLIVDEKRVARWDALVIRPQQKADDLKRDYAQDAKKIQEAIVASTVVDSRAWFYWGQSLKDAKDYQNAMEVFSERTRMEGDRELTFWAFMWCAKLATTVEKTPEAILGRMLDAVAYAPDRAEPHHLLAHYLLDKEPDESRRAFATAKACAYPVKARHFVDVVCYSDEALKAAGISLF